MPTKAHHHTIVALVENKPGDDGVVMGFGGHG